MDKLEQYRQCIQTIVPKHGKYKHNREEIENELIFDTVHDHYQLMRFG